MHLLVSTASAADAAAAVAGGADIVDAKDPNAGSLGAVPPLVLRQIHASVAGARPITAALGDARAESPVERAARDAASAGMLLVKVGFAGVASTRRARSLAAAAVHGARLGSGGDCGVILVAYADAARVGSVGAHQLVDVAAAVGAFGILLDTAAKDGGGLLQLVPPAAVAAWIAAATEASLLVALAGSLTADDLPVVRELGPDIVGVRGAACDGGRGGPVSAARVRRLRALCAPAGDVRLPIGGVAPLGLFDAVQE